MPKIKCPCCGSIDVAKILYGYPAFGLYDNENIVLGGCCVEVNSPQRYCRACECRFRKTSLGLSCIVLRELKFEVIEKDRFYNLIIKSSNALPCITLTVNGVPTNVELNAEEWFEFQADVGSCEIDCWNDKYRGNRRKKVEWALHIEISEGTVYDKYGINALPPYWNKWIKVLEKYSMV